MIITHDKYMALQSLIVLHLSGVERETGKGLDRDELIDWYLESREEEIRDVEELEYEKELIVKMIRKLVKVRVAGLKWIGLVLMWFVDVGQLFVGDQGRRAGVAAVYG